MGDFQITEDKIHYIATEFGVTEASVKDLYSEYKKLAGVIKTQYLAHMMRSLEVYIRKEQQAPFFSIICTPMSEGSKNFGVGCASYQPKKFFSMMYHPDMDERQLRVCLAHELGHLLLVVRTGKNYNDQTEPLSSIFGIFTILDKNDFYINRTVPFRHKSWEDVILDFKQLKNRAAGKDNIS